MGLHDVDADDRGQALGVMPLADKMAILWGRQRPEVHTDDTAERFVGVEDVDGDLDEDHPQLSMYTRTIFDSEAYACLLQRLQTASSLHWGEFKTGLNELRLQVLSALPTGTISSRGSPDSHIATFRLQRLPLERRVRYECQNQIPGRERHISEFVVLTRSSVDQIQATTVKEYLEQTWGMEGRDVLEPIQRALATLRAGNLPCEY